MPILNLVLSKAGEIRRLYKECGLTAPAVSGSVTRGEDTENSDIDFLYRFDTGNYFDLYDLEVALRNMFSRNIDLCNQDKIKPLFEPHIKSETIELG